jgi:hypothetical protein
MTVEFAFEIDQKVKTPIGDLGIVTNLCINNTKQKQVFIQTSNGGDWWREDQIKAAE